jgi:8-oxo-dGTP pyrophosphatase MutT (NUDIX family)
MLQQLLGRSCSDKCVVPIVEIRTLQVMVRAKPAGPQPEHRSQVAALPVREDEDGTLRALLITSRDTGRWIIPKGWPMKGRKDHEAAAQEALEEAGVVGRVNKTPLGSYVYWKRQTDHFELCSVTVYLLSVDRHRKTWLEMDQRKATWFTIDEAAALIQDRGLSTIIRGLLPEALASPMRPRNKRPR